MEEYVIRYHQSNLCGNQYHDEGTLETGQSVALDYYFRSLGISIDDWSPVVEYSHVIGTFITLVPYSNIVLIDGYRITNRA